MQHQRLDPLIKEGAACRTLYDIVIIGVRANDKFRGAAARNAARSRRTGTTTAISKPEERPAHE